jgi:hypothetical protein
LAVAVADLGLVMLDKAEAQVAVQVHRQGPGILTVMVLATNQLFQINMLEIMEIRAEDLLPVTHRYTGVEVAAEVLESQDILLEDIQDGVTAVTA